MDRPVVYWERMSKGDNHRGGGHGVYFDDPDGHIFGLLTDDPNGHLLEIITRPYGSGGTAASRPHPLVARTLGPEDYEGRLSGTKTNFLE